MIFFTKETGERIGEFADFLKNVSSNVLIIISAADTFGESSKGKALLKALTDAEMGGASLDEATSLEIAHHAIGHLKDAITSIHPELLKIFSDQQLTQCIARSVRDAPAAIPFLNEHSSPTAGLVILGCKPTSSRQLLAKIALVDETNIIATPISTAAEIEHLIILHEAFHVRKSKSHTKDPDALETFIEEILADRFALREAAKLPGHGPAIAEYTTARCLTIFHGGRPENSLGMALTSLAEDATKEQYRDLFEAAQGFRQKVIDYSAEKSGSEYLPSAIRKLLGTCQKYNLSEGLSAVKNLRTDSSFTPLEDQIAAHYLQAAEKWLTPAPDNSAVNTMTISAPVQAAIPRM